jgi:nucleoside-diphosphate-sugar epimerase
VKKLVFASSGCDYPNHLQEDPDEVVYLKEDNAVPPFDADGTYGWAKLMAELTLRAYHRDHGLRSVSCRYFTVYGPRAAESHAVTAMIARAYVRQDPFEIWGDGRQIRNWTYVDDVVRGTILAAEHIDDASAVNLGTGDRMTVFDTARAACEALGHHPTFRFLPTMPTGPRNRVADGSRARELLGWRPEVPFTTGLDRTVRWYRDTHRVDEVKADLARLLTERS